MCDVINFEELLFFHSRIINFGITQSLNFFFPYYLGHHHDEKQKLKKERNSKRNYDPV